MEWKTSDNPVDYEEALQAMEARVADIISGQAQPLVWLCSHPPLYTAGSSANESDLLEKERFPVYHTGRGGQFTYHGPGQRVAYLMLDLKQRCHPLEPDIRHYVQLLEEWLIATLAHFGIAGEIKEGRVGVWVNHPTKGECKIAAIGIRVRKWVTFHGIALNVSPDLSHYSGIVPCGISNFGVTSLEDMGIYVSIQEVDMVLKAEFLKIFE